MTLLLLSILGLGLGPLLDRFARQKGTVVPLLEGFVAATILGLVFGHILPEAVQTSGWLCLPVAAAGLVAPQILENRVRGSEGGIHGAVAILALAALLVHTVFDGAALASGHHQNADTTSSALAIGVVLHRLPVGLTVWWLIRRAAGTTAAVAAILTIGLGTGIGFTAGEAVVERLDTLSVALFQAFVASGLIHVVLHRSLAGEEDSSQAQRMDRVGRFAWSGVGALIGTAVLLAVPLSGHHAEEEGQVAATFLSYWHSCAPFVLAGFVVVGIIDRFGRNGRPAWVILVRDMFCGPSRCHSLVEAVPQAGRSLGLRLSVLWLALIPVTGADLILLSVPLWGVERSGIRLAGAALVAAVAALLAGSSASRKDSDRTLPAEAPRTHETPPAPRSDWSAAVDRTMPWLLIGLVCATFIERFLPIEWLPGLPRPLAVAGAAIVGAFVSLPAVALIPIATPLLQKGLSQGAAIALLVTGPTVTRFSYGWLSDRYGKAPALAFAAAITTGAVAVGLEADAILDSPRAPDLISGSVSLWRLACSLALGLLAVRTLLRLGPGGMVAQLGTHRREHDHEVH